MVVKQFILTLHYQLTLLYNNKFTYTQNPRLEIFGDFLVNTKTDEQQYR